ncbi:helix-turn-helix transcriptional regulator [Pseudorhodobacter ferrugineus]|uniref:helix-turn-helix transcriptional regulator n=1 Tax=Pseudorhodobacter ferrugineus TaxID=77008 RepID=UPI0003B3ABD1|nr:helix-turn-helix transcriptional regulator [Pseudorhodobacter ferrugineus]
MMVFPLPLLTFVMAAVAGALVWRIDFGLTVARNLFAAFFAIVACGALLVGLRFGYGVEQLIPLQRALPLFGGPLLYLGFAVLATPSLQTQRLIALHLGIAVAAAALPNTLLGWAGLDSVIALSYSVYAAAIFWLWRKGQNNLVRARLEMVGALHRAMLWAAGFLVAMVLIDTAIAISFALQRSDKAVQLISFGSIGLIGLMLLAIITAASFGAARKPQPAALDLEDDMATLEQAAAVFLTSTQLYLDPALSIDRLAKRMHVPMRNLSAAINQTKAMNVSQYVNGFRLAHAARLLRDTDQSVTDIAAQSGFLSRSNFYREFQRSYTQSPAAYRLGGEG